MSRRNRKPPRRKPRIGKVTSEADARPADDLPTKAIPLRGPGRATGGAPVAYPMGGAGEHRCRWPT